MDTIDTKIAGVVAVLIKPEGQVVAEATDFSQVKFSGYTLRESQERRAKHALVQDYFAQMCPADLADCIKLQSKVEIVRKLINQKDYRQHVFAVNHDQEGTVNGG